MMKNDYKQDLSLHLHGERVTLFRNQNKNSGGIGQNENTHITI